MAGRAGRAPAAGEGHCAAAALPPRCRCRPAPPFLLLTHRKCRRHGVIKERDRSHPARTAMQPPGSHSGQVPITSKPCSWRLSRHQQQCCRGTHFHAMPADGTSAPAPAHAPAQAQYSLPAPCLLPAPCPCPCTRKPSSTCVPGAMGGSRCGRPAPAHAPARSHPQAQFNKFQGAMGDSRSSVTSFQPSTSIARSMAAQLGNERVRYVSTSSRSRYLRGGWASGIRVGVPSWRTEG